MDVFTVTSTKPYDQCYYELHMSNGSKTVWNDYEELRNHWMSVRGSGMSHVVVQKRATLRTGTRKPSAGFA